jgi:hypothetical protein
MLDEVKINRVIEGPRKVPDMLNFGTALSDMNRLD